MKNELEFPCVVSCSAQQKAALHRGLGCKNDQSLRTERLRQPQDANIRDVVRVANTKHAVLVARGDRTCLTWPSRLTSENLF